SLPPSVPLLPANSARAFPPPMSPRQRKSSPPPPASPIASNPPPPSAAGNRSPKVPKSPKVFRPPQPRSPPSPFVSNDFLVSGFPFSSCDYRDAAMSSYRLSPPRGPRNMTPSSATYCFTLMSGAAPVDTANRCAQMTPDKITFIINAACAAEVPRAISKTTVNGVRVSPTFSHKNWNDRTYGLMTIGKFAAANASNGIVVCMALARRSSCGTPAGLCYGSSCVYSLFNSDNSCCPVSQVTAAPSAR
ncbi:hypothetical protein Vretifemale_17462, partial [Volvox reticuliferus]